MTRKKSSPDISKCPLLFVVQLLSHVQIVATPYPLSLRHISFSCIFSCATHSFIDFSVTQSCPTLCDPMNGSLPGFSIHGIFQARIVESVAISFSREPLGKLDQVFHMGHPPCVRGYPVSTQATSPSQGVTAVILHCQFILQSFGASASVLFTLY